MQIYEYISRKLDLRPVLLLIILYGPIRVLPFGIFGWIQNEDGILEWSSVLLLLIAAYNVLSLLVSNKNNSRKVIIWTLFLLTLFFMIGEEISWGERLHGYSIDFVRSLNTQNETNFHNIKIFHPLEEDAMRYNLRSLLHHGWIIFALILGIANYLFNKLSFFPASKLSLYFLIPCVWYFLFEYCRFSGRCLITVSNHQEIYEFLIAIGLWLHTRIQIRKVRTSINE